MKKIFNFAKINYLEGAFLSKYMKFYSTISKINCFFKINNSCQFKIILL